MLKFIVHEDSMRPTLRPGDRLLAVRMGPVAGDIVCFPDPTGSDRWFVKRVVAGPGSRVDVDGDRISVETDTGRRSLVVPRTERPRHLELHDDEVFVLSDAADVTRADSRVYGPISTQEMHTVMVRYAPLRRIAMRSRLTAS